jgi:hypothetical protein
METTGSRLILYRNKDAQFRFWPFADIHLGQAGCTKHQLEADIKQVKDDPYSVWGLFGDYADFINVRDRRFDASVFDEEILAKELASLGAYLMEKVYKYFEPIKEKCLGLGFGNHEYMYMKDNDHAHMHELLCKHMDAKNLGYCGLFDLYLKHDAGLRKSVSVIKDSGPVRGAGVFKVRIGYHHGFGAAATAGGKINALKKLTDQFDANLLICGHMHEKVSKGFVRLGANEDCTKIVEIPYLGIVTGSYLKTYHHGVVSYGEIKGYPPTILGVSCARIIPCQRQLIAENSVVLPENAARIS